MASIISRVSGVRQAEWQGQLGNLLDLIGYEIVEFRIYFQFDGKPLKYLTIEVIGYM